MKTIRSVSKYIAVLALLLFLFAGAVPKLPDLAVSASAAMTAEQFISSGYDDYQTESFTGDGEIHLNGKVYSSGIKLNGGFMSTASISFGVADISRLTFAFGAEDE